MKVSINKQTISALQGVQNHLTSHFVTESTSPFLFNSFKSSYKIHRVKEKRSSLSVGLIGWDEFKSKLTSNQSFLIALRTEGNQRDIINCYAAIHLPWHSGPSSSSKEKVSCRIRFFATQDSAKHIGLFLASRENLSPTANVPLRCNEWRLCPSTPPLS